MANPQLFPLEINPRTGEPFLRLRNKKNIILTPARSEDVSHYIINMNDSRISQWLSTPPVPFLPEHAEVMYQNLKTVSDGALETLEGARDSLEPVLVHGCPIGAIREVNDDGSETYLGHIKIARFRDGKVFGPPDEEYDEKKAAKYVEANMSLPVGDPNIVWTVAYHIGVSHHGKGIMTDALQTLLWDWAVPRMGVQHIVSGGFDGNGGSLRILQKAGFVQVRLIENYTHRLGQWRHLRVFEWRRSDVEPPAKSS